MINQLDSRELADPENRNGHAPYPELIIVSSPRSGLNLIRHMVESMANVRTPGKLHIHQTGKLIFHRTHNGNTHKISPGRAPVYDSQGKTPYKNLILLLRDPREILVRSYNKDFEKFREYCDNITAYEMFSGEKKVIYYDDLISDDSVFKDFFDILNLSNNFDISMVPKLRLDSIKWYDKFQIKGEGSKTKGKPTSLRCHQRELSESELKQLWSLLKSETWDTEKYFYKWANLQGWR